MGFDYYGIYQRAPVRSTILEICRQYRIICPFVFGILVIQPCRSHAFLAFMRFFMVLYISSGMPGKPFDSR